MENKHCLVCELDSQSVPLIGFEFKGETHYICPQHLPVLIHKPATLADRLPGLELLGDPDSH